MRRVNDVALAALGCALLLNLGIPVGPNNAIRAADVLVLVTLAAWWLGGARVRPWIIPAASVATATLATGLLTSAGLPDLVFSLRLAEAPILLCAASYLGPRRLRWLGLGSLAGACAVSGIVLYEAKLATTGGWRAVRDFDLLLARFVVKEEPGTLWWASGGLLRPTGPFNHPNAAAGILAVMVILAFAAALAVRPWTHRLVLIVVASWVAVGVVLTGSRGAALALVFGVVAILGATLSRSRPGAPSLFPLGALALALAASTTIGRGSYVARLATAATVETDPTVSGRLASWSRAFDLIVQHPFSGLGREGVLAVLPATHNGILFAAAALGLPIAFALGALLVLTVRRASRLLREHRDPVAWAAAGAGLVAVILFLIEDRSVDATFLAMLALLAGASLGFSKVTRRRPRLTGGLHVLYPHRRALGVS